MTGKLNAGIKPFSSSGKDAEITAEIYIVTGFHGFLRIPESFCKECHLFVNAVNQAAEEVDAEVDVQVKSYWTRFLRPLLKGGIHPPVLLLNGELFSQGYDVPEKKELVEKFREMSV